MPRGRRVETADRIPKQGENHPPYAEAADETKPTHIHNSLSKIAHLYYIENLGQREIAQRMNVSIASVSRSLAKARELKIVNITVQGGENDFSRLEIEMERRFRLKECLLVPGSGRIEYTYQNMAAAAADLFSRSLKPGDILGVSWGETLKAISENLPESVVDRVDVIPIIGAMGRIETGIYPNSIARNFALKLGGDAYLVNTPAFVDNSETRSSLMEDSNFRPVRDIWSRLDMAVLGVSSLIEESSMHRGGIFTAEDLARMRTEGGECISNFILFDAGGRVVEAKIADRMVSLPVEDLRRIRSVVIVAAGPSKAKPLSVMLRSGLCTALITDADCARAVLAG